MKSIIIGILLTSLFCSCGEGEEALNDLLEQGKAKVDSSEWREAFDIYTKAIELNPDYAEA